MKPRDGIRFVAALIAAKLADGATALLFDGYRADPVTAWIMAALVTILWAIREPRP